MFTNRSKSCGVTRDLFSHLLELSPQPETRTELVAVIEHPPFAVVVETLLALSAQHVVRDLFVFFDRDGAFHHDGR